MPDINRPLDAATQTGHSLALKVLQDHGTALFTTQNLAAGAQSLTNQLDPTGDRATFGSVAPDAEIYNGNLVMNGAGGGWVADTPTKTPTGNFVVDSYFSMPDLTPTTPGGLAAQYETTGNNRSWAISIRASGSIMAHVSFNGSTFSTLESSDVLGSVLAVAQSVIVRSPYVFTGTQLEIAFQYSTDGGDTWLALGTTQTLATTETSVYSCTAPLVVGARYTTSGSPFEEFTGSISRVNVHDDTISFSSYADGATQADNFSLVAAAGVDLNDPTVVPGSTFPYYATPGTVDNYLRLATTPWGGTPDWVEVVTRVRATGSVVVKPVGAESTHLAFHYVPGTGEFSLAARSTSGFCGNAVSPTPVPVSLEGEWVWLKARLNRITAELEYYYSASNTTQLSSVSWTSLGTVVGTNAGEDLIGAALGTFILIGQGSTGASSVPHDVAYASLEASNRAVVVWDPSVDISASPIPQTAYVAADGNSYSVSRSATGNKGVLVGMSSVIQSDGTDDYIQLPASLTPTWTATTGTETVVVCARRYGGSTDTTLYSSEGVNSQGGLLYNATASLSRSFAGGSFVSAGTYPDGDIVVSALIVSDGDMFNYVHTLGKSAALDITSVTISHTAPRVFSRAYSVTLLGELDVYSVAIFNAELTTDELDAVSAYLKGLA